MEEIILWESNIERIHDCETAVYQALKKIGYNARLIVNSEMPLLSRHQLWERLPVLEIRGQYWSLCPGCAFTAEQLTRLFAKIFIEQIATCSNPDADAGLKAAPVQTAAKGEANDR
jgi:hypothetical protein